MSSAERSKRLAALRLRANAARKANQDEVREEWERMQGPGSARPGKKKAAAAGGGGDRELQETAAAHQRKTKCRGTASGAAEGEEEDRAFLAYQRRLKNLPGREAGSVAAMQEELAKLREAREKARQKKRRRDADTGEVDYINNANKQFNKKVREEYDKYTVEIRQNLERGTAL